MVPQRLHSCDLCILLPKVSNWLPRLSSISHNLFDLLIKYAGDEGLKELVLRSSKKFPSEKWGVQVQKDEGAEWKDRFRVYFPSQRTVRHSKGGPASAGTICFQPKWYNSDAQRIMRDNVSRRKGVLTHNKVWPRADIS